jgi:HD-GYP domain-containing protein (c-di-GMP phosphodiesterase class II)
MPCPQNSHFERFFVSNRQVALCGISPEVEGLRWESTTLLRIGRQGSFDVVLQHPSVSRQHAEVVVRGQGCAVRDLGSHAGTFLNGVPVGRSYQRVQDEDVLQCGDLALRILITEGEAQLSIKPETAAPAIHIEAGEAHLKTSGTFLRIQASAEHTWGQALDAPPLPRAQQLAKGTHLLGLLRMGHNLCHVGSLDELLQSILDDAVVVLDAQRGCVILDDETTGRLDLHAVSFSKRPMSSSRIFSRTLAGHCFSQGQSLLCRDVRVERDLCEAGSISHGAMSSIICALLRSPRQRLGVLHLDRGPLQEPFTAEDFQLADAIAASISYGIENARLLQSQRELFLQTVSALAQSVEMRDQYTGNHTQRVTQYALMLAHELQLPAGERQQIQIATPLHDIGKIAIDDAVLRKPGRLTAEEFEQMKTHVVRGAAILETIPGLRAMIPIIRNHHERWDGTGYPDRLVGEAIPRMARIVAVADAFDAMTSDRPYRRALTPGEAFQELEAKSGTHFDPECVAAFLRLRPRVEAMLTRPGSGPPAAGSLTDSVMRREVMRLLNASAPLQTLIPSGGRSA